VRTSPRDMKGGREGGREGRRSYLGSHHHLQVGGMETQLQVKHDAALANLIVVIIPQQQLGRANERRILP